MKKKSVPVSKEIQQVLLVVSQEVELCCTIPMDKKMIVIEQKYTKEIVVVDCMVNTHVDTSTIIIIIIIIITNVAAVTETPPFLM